MKAARTRVRASQIDAKIEMFIARATLAIATFVLSSLDDVSASTLTIPVRALVGEDIFESSSASSVRVPSSVSRLGLTLERVRVPSGSIAVRAPGPDRVFRAYVYATNETLLRLEKRRSRPSARVEDSISDSIERMLAARAIERKTSHAITIDDGWRVVDDVQGVGASAWVVFDACDDAWIDTEPKRALEYRIAAYETTMNNDDTQLRGNRSHIVAYVAVADIVAGGHRCERSHRSRP